MSEYVCVSNDRESLRAGSLQCRLVLMRPPPFRCLSLHLPPSFFTSYSFFNTAIFSTASNSQWFVMSVVASCGMPVFLQTIPSRGGEIIQQKDKG